MFEARKLVQSMNSGADDPEGHHPDLTIPETLSDLPTLSQYLEIRQVHRKGLGFVARQNLPAGTLLLVEKPIAIVLDSEVDGDDDGNQPGGQITAYPVATPTSEPSGAHIEEVTQEDLMEYDDDNREDFEDVDDDDAILDTEAAGSEENDPRINELLLLEVLDQLNSNPKLWEEQLSKLFPRTDEQVALLPAWVCHDDDIFVEFENGIRELERQHHILRPFVKDISKRLPLIIRYNILSMETCPELLSYPGPEGFSNLSGVGLYYLPSFFNHSKQPNCARYAVGDVMFFVSNQSIAAGDEVCISYIEHDILCEPAVRRNLMLSMNFTETDDDFGQNDIADNSGFSDTAAVKYDGPEMPVVDSDVQNELMGMNALERLKAIDELLLQATGQKLPQDGGGEQATTGAAMETSIGDDDNRNISEGISATWFQCDVQNLRILKAITLESLGQSQLALALWEGAIHFCDTKMPPLDENGVPLRVQAALTSWYLGDVAKAQEYAKAALDIHNLLFGGGVPFFRIRLGPDLRLSLRPANRSAAMTNVLTDAVTALWPYGG